MPILYKRYLNRTSRNVKNCLPSLSTGYSIRSSSHLSAQISTLPKPIRTRTDYTSIDTMYGGKSPSQVYSDSKLICLKNCDQPQLKECLLLDLWHMAKYDYYRRRVVSDPLRTSRSDPSTYKMAEDFLARVQTLFSPQFSRSWATSSPAVHDI